MSDLAKLKKKATEYEQKKQYDKALALYQQVVAEQGEGEEADIALCNRVGDLLQRAGRTDDALLYYEQAVDLYAARGFLNNAIALCNKILRVSPSSVSAHHKLGRIAARKGFKSDARRHFLEYAESMQRVGQLDAAFAALSEFAELCPDQDDVRLTLADSLARHGRNEEALTHLDALHARYRRTGRHGEAEAARERMRAIDPEYEPQVVAESEVADDFLYSLERPPAAGGRGAERAAGTEEGLVLIGPDAGVGASRGRRGEAAPDEANAGEPGVITAADVAPSGVVVPVEPPDAGAAGAPLDGIEFGGEFDAPPAAAAAVAGVADGLELDGVAPAGVDASAVHAPSPDGFESHAAADGFADGFTDAARTIEAVGTAAGGQVDGEHGEREHAEREHGDGEPGDGEHGDGAAGELHFITGPDGEELVEFEASDVEAPSAPGLDAAEELAAEGARRPRDRDVLDELGVALPEAGSSGASSDALELSADDALLFDLPAIETDGSDGSWTEPEPAREAPAPETGVASLADPAIPVWRRVSDALLAAGDHEGALRELDAALAGCEDTGDMVAAGAVIDEIIRIAPDDVARLRQRAELAYRGGDRDRIRSCARALADALDARGERSGAAAVRARLDEVEGAARPAASPPMTAPAADDSWVNLGDLLRADEPERTTRMVVEEQAPSGDEQADFAEMLAKFKQGLLENVDAEDYESHHDLGVAFREMGLLDEAIVEFQKALRGTRHRARTLEALGECFLEKEHYQLAAATLRRALQDAGSEDDQLVGVLYLLGVALDALGQRDEAARLYERVLAVDYQFRDAADRAAAAVRGA